MPLKEMHSISSYISSKEMKDTTGTSLSLNLIAVAKLSVSEFLDLENSFICLYLVYQINRSFMLWYNISTNYSNSLYF